MSASHGTAAYTTQASGVTTFNAAAPSGDLNAKVLLAFQNCDVGALSALTTPTGGTTWQLGTSLSTVSGSTPSNFKLWWKVGGPSEPSTYGMGMDSGADSAVTMIRIDDADITATPVFATPAGLTTTAATINSPSLTPGGTTDIEYRFACGVGNASTNPVWFFTAATPVVVPLTNNQSQTFSNHRGGYRQLTSGAATGTITVTSRNAANTSSINQVPRQAVTVSVRSAPLFQGWGFPI